MARLTPEQSQALAGAWYTIVGRGGGGGRGGRGGHGRGRGRRHQSSGNSQPQPVPYPVDDDSDTAVGAWRGYERGGYGWGRGYGYGYPYAAVNPYVAPVVPYPYGYHHYPYGYHHHHHHLPVAPAVEVDPAGPTQPVSDPAATPAQPQVTAQAQGQYSIVGRGIRPRNLLVEDPGPDRAGREVLPMSTGVAILPTQSAQITARPQRVAFRPERVFISAAGTSGGAADWVVNDIKIGNRSQFSQSGDVPGDMFATNAIDGFVSFETAQTAMDVVMVVTYIGLNESGVPFFASIVGTAAI